MFISSITSWETGHCLQIAATLPTAAHGLPPLIPSQRCGSILRQPCPFWKAESSSILLSSIHLLSKHKRFQVVTDVYYIWCFSIKNSTDWQSTLHCYHISSNTRTDTKANSCLKLHQEPSRNEKIQVRVYNFSRTTTARSQPPTIRRCRRLEFVSVPLRHVYSWENFSARCQVTSLRKLGNTTFLPAVGYGTLTRRLITPGYSFHF